MVIVRSGLIMLKAMELIDMVCKENERLKRCLAEQRQRKIRKECNSVKTLRGYA